MDREKAGKRATTVAIGSNCFLTVFNILVGLYCGSYALIAEGLHTLSDIITSVIAYIGFRISQKPADEGHPMGHGRAEPICGLVISPVIVADGQHQRTDIYSSIAILAGIVASNMGFPILDPIVGLIIGILILKTAYSIGKENIDAIMGKVPDENLSRKIKRVVEKTPDASGAHNIKIDNYGPYYTANLHIKVDGDLTVAEAHKIVHLTEQNIMKKIPEIQSVSVHACPLGVEYKHEQKIDEK